MSRQVLTSTYLHGIVDRYADLAQLAERIHGKDEVAGSIPAISIKYTEKPLIYEPTEKVIKLMAFLLY